NNYLLVDYSNLKGLVKTDTEQGQKINEKLEQAGVENIDDYAAQYRACGENESCQKQVVIAEMQAISRSYDIIDELAKSGELSKTDIDFIQSTLVPRVRSAFDSKAKDKTAQEVYRSGNLETFAKYEQRLTEARFSAQLKAWIDSGLTDSQILKKIEDEPLKIALSTAGPNINGKQPSGSGYVIPSVGNIKQTLSLIRNKATSNIKEEISIPNNFANKQKLDDHFEKHHKEFGKIYSSSSEYLDGARNVIKNGYKINYQYKGENRDGYVLYIGNTKKGESKFAFVGTNNNGEITTYHIESGKDFWKMINGDKNMKIIKPIKIEE
ncbi:hypothetical protein, partial [Ursidibacter sp. B-7004-1]